MQQYLRILAIPLLILALFATLFLVWELAGLPEGEVFMEIARGWFDRYGVAVVFVSAFIEGLLLIGSYFPGGTVLILAVILAESPQAAAFVVLVGTIALYAAHSVNYFLGKYGWYRILVRFGMKNALDDARERVVRRGALAIFASYWMPSIGALTDTAAGILQMPLRLFMRYALLSLLFWNSIIGALVYLFKETMLSFVSPSHGAQLVFIVIGIWMFAIIIGDLMKRRRLARNGAQEE